MAKKKTMKLELEPAVMERLEKLVTDSGADDRCDVIRRALAMYEYLVGHARSRARVCVCPLNADPIDVDVLRTGSIGVNHRIRLAD